MSYNDGRDMCSLLMEKTGEWKESSVLKKILWVTHLILYTLYT